MKKVLKVSGFLFATIILLAIGGVTYIKTALPNVGPAPELKVELTPERVARGEYLANSVMLCMDCHTQRDWTQFAGPIKKEIKGAGGERYGHEIGMPGVVYSRNLTPASLGNWTDGEIFRAVTAGVSKDGTPLFPIMPYEDYGRLEKEDIYAVIAYLRTLSPIPNEVPDRELDFPLNLIVHTIPKPATHEMQRPAKTDTVAYGQYLVNSAGCTHCHTPQNEDHKFIAEAYLSGGVEFPQPNGVMRSANITQDKESGIGGWTREQFIGHFKRYTDPNFKLPEIGPKDLNTPMPWAMYATMDTSDLSAIYSFLKTVKPVENQVRRVSKASL